MPAFRVAMPASPATASHLASSGTPGLQREVVFVALGFAGMALGLAVDGADGPPVLRWIGYGVAYAFGGWFGLRAGLDALRHLRVDIDLLMVLAALGALVIGAPSEGALLLFLFALSNVLQHFATGRSRQAIRALMKLRPEEAQIRRGDAVETVPIDAVEPGEPPIIISRIVRKLPLVLACA